MCIRDSSISTGNVGIGTSTPFGILNIATTSPYFYISDTDASEGNKHWFLTNNSGSFSIGTTTDSLLLSNTKALTITNSGSIGISTTSPMALLSVESRNANDIGLLVKGSTGQTANLFEIQDSSSNQLLIVDSSGKVGIGTTTPAYKLDVEGNIRATLSLSAGINVETLSEIKTLRWFI